MKEWEKLQLYIKVANLQKSMEEYRQFEGNFSKIQEH